MPGDVLSQEEVESLLNQASGGGAPAAGGGGGAQAAEAPSPAEQAEVRKRKVAQSSASNLTKQREKIEPYDFKRPERVGKDQVVALRTMYEGFARNFSASLSTMLRGIVEMKLLEVDQITYSEFILYLENPTVCNLITAPPLEGHLILDMNLSIMYPIIDRMLGGGSETTSLAQRALTEIEERLASKVTTLFLEEMKQAWENIVDLEPTIDRVESNPMLVQILPPNEVVISVTFELIVHDVRGTMSLCIPYNSIERISGDLSANSWIAYGKNQSTPETMEMITETMKTSLIELEVLLAKTQIKAGDLIGLKVGDILTTEKNVESPMVLGIHGNPKYYVRAGAFEGQKAILIESEIGDLNDATLER